MQLGLLVESKMRPIPDSIKIIATYGKETVFLSNKKGEPSGLAVGDVVVVEGENQSIIDWLKPFDGIWELTGPGMFRVVHIK